MKLFFKSIYFLLVAGIITVALLIVATMIPIPGNFKVKVVKSGSMEPAIHTGGIVVIRPSPPYAVGDIVTFGKDTKTQIPTTHRIVAISGDQDPLYTTQGDANDTPDPTPTRASEVHGKVFLTVPYVGFVLDFARTPPGFALLVGVPAALIILEEIGKIVREIRRLRRKKMTSTYHAEPTPEKIKIR